MMRKIAYHTHNVGCLWNRLVKPVNFKNNFAFSTSPGPQGPLHRVPRDLQKLTFLK